MISAVGEGGKQEWESLAWAAEGGGDSGMHEKKVPAIYIYTEREIKIYKKEGHR